MKGGKPNKDYQKAVGGKLRRAFSVLLLIAGIVAVAGLFAQTASAQTNEMTVIAGFTDCTPIKGGLASCNAGNTGSSGSATSAKLTFPYGVAFGSNGYVYIADGLNGAIRQVTPGGSISTFAVVNGAGSGTVVNAVTTDASGNVFFGDNQGTVYMNATGALTSFFGQAIEALAPDNQGNLYILTTAADAGSPFFLYVFNLNSKTGAQIAATDGSTAGISFKDSFFGLAVDSGGNPYTIDPIYTGGAGGTGLPTILAFSMTSTGGGLPTVSSIFPALQFTSLFPVFGQSLVIDPAGNFYINEGSAVLKYVPGTNFAPIVAGTGTGGYNSGENVGGEPLPSNSNELNQVGGIFVSPSGVLYIADTGNNLVRSVSNSTGCQECGPNTLALTDQLPVNSFGFDVNPVTQQLYVPLVTANTVNVYDAKSDVLIASIPVGKAPGKVAIDSVNNIIYVPNTGEDSVSVIDGKTNTWNSTVGVGGPPLSVAVDPTLNKAYVAIANGTSIGVIKGPPSGGFASPGASIANVFIPSALAVDTKNNLVYVRCFCASSPLGEEVYSMDVIDATTDTVTNILELFQGQDTDIATDSIAVDETSGQVVIADSELPSVHIWVPPTQNTIGYFESYNPNFYPEHVVVDSSNEVAYFTDGYGNSKSLNLATHQSLLLSQAANVETTCGAAANVIAPDPSTNQAYMTVCPETVADPNCTTAACAGLDLFDGPTGKLITQLPLGNPSGNFNIDSGEFAIAVNPSTHTVYVENTLTNTINVINGPSVVGARPALAFSPSPINFGPVAVGTTPFATLTVTNSGTGPTTLTPTILLSTGSGFPQISPVTCPVPPATLAGGGAQCTYNVTFTPPAGIAELFSGTIIFADSGLDTPQTVNFSGTIGLTTVGFSPSPLTFDIPYGTSVELPITVTNEGSAPLKITNVALAQSGPTSFVNDFSVFSSCTGASGIAPGSTCTITVTYSPFFQPAGSTEPVVVNVTDNASGSPQSISVIGVSGAATLGYATFSSSSTLNFGSFGNVAVNQANAPQQIAMYNGGGGPLTINSITVTGSNSADFQILPLPSTTSNTTCPIGGGTLAQAKSCLIYVLFTPSSQPTAQETAQISISESNSPVSPQTIALSGTSSVPLGPPTSLPVLASSDNSVPPNFANAGNGSPPTNSSAAMSSGGQFVAFSAGATDLPGPVQPSSFEAQSGVYLRNTCLGQGPGCQQNTSFIAIGPTGTACSGAISAGSQYPAIDNSGQFVAFTSSACQFNGVNSTNANQLFVRDVINGTTSLVSVDSTPGPVSLGVAIFPFTPFSMSTTNPQSLAFAYETTSPNVVSGVANPSAIKELYWTNVCTALSSNTCTSSTSLVSQTSANTNVAANNTAEEPSISANGRYVAFASTATNLVSGVTIPTISAGVGYEQIYLRDTCVGATGSCTPSTTLISLASAPVITTNRNPANTNPSVSSDGRFVAFASSDNNLLQNAGVTFASGTDEPEIFLADTCRSNGTVVCATPTIKPLSQFMNIAGNFGASSPFISADGRLITFISNSSNLGSNDSSFVQWVYEYDTCQINGAVVNPCPSPGLSLLSNQSNSQSFGTVVDATDQLVSLTITTNTGSYPTPEVYVGGTIVPASSIPTTMMLAVSPAGEALSGQPVTLTAKLTVTASGTRVSGVQVAFLDGSLSLGTATTDGTGTASFTTAMLSGGPHTLLASFSAKGSYGTSSAPANLFVFQLISIQVTPPTMTVAVNGTQQFTATGTYSNGSTGPIAGTVIWTATSTPSGVASINSSGLATGLMSGTATIIASQGGISGTATLTVPSSSPPPVILSVTPNFGPSAGGTVVVIAGQNFQSGATVSFGTTAATGVRLISAGTIQATTPALTAGLVTVTVSNPDGQLATLPGGFVATSSSLPPVSIVVSEAIAVTDTPSMPDVFDPEVINVTDTVSVMVLTPTTTTVASSANPSTVNQPVTFTATVAPTSGTGSLTGTVAFTDNGTAIAGCSALAVAAVTGNASCITSALAAGSNVIVATYGNDPNFSTSTGTIAQVVSKANTTIALASSANPTSVNQPVTFTATVAPAASGSAQLTGTVAFTDNGTAIAGCSALAVAVVTGKASCTTSALAAGSNVIVATYGNDPNFSTSTGTIAQVVSEASTTIALTSSVNPTSVNQPVTFTATVAPAASGSVQLTGTVAFTGNGTAIAGCSALAVAVVTGRASCTTSALAAGSNVIVATYGSDPNFSTSAGTITQTVIKVIPTIQVQATVGTGAEILTATVSPVAGGVPTGSVTFTYTLSGVTVTLGTVQLTTQSGSTVAVLSTSSLPFGADNITATYSGDPTFTVISSGTTVNPDFTITASVSTVTVAAGQTSQPITITATSPTGFASQLSLGCGTVPAYIHCLFTPITIPTVVPTNTTNPTSTFVVSVDLTNAALEKQGRVELASAAPLALLGLISLLCGKRKRWILYAGMVLLFVSAAGALTGCASSYSNSPASNLPPAGNQVIIVNATANGGVVHPLNLTINITN